MIPFVDPSAVPDSGSSLGFIISAVCAGIASIIASIAMIGRRRAQADPEDSVVRIRERLTAQETHDVEQDRRLDNLEEEVRLYRAVQVADEQAIRRKR